jgi:hypothetical protein
MGTTPGFHGFLGHMVSKRFAHPAYHPAQSSPGFHLATAYNLGSQSWSPSTGLGQGFRPTSGSQIPSGQRGDSSYRQLGSRLLQPHFCGPKEADRLIIDLSRILRVPHFKMETTRLVAAAMLPGDWAVSLHGPMDAYLHVPVYPDYQHYLRFYYTIFFHYGTELLVIPG